MNAHPGQEFNYVLEGSILVVVDGHDSSFTRVTPSTSMRGTGTA